MTKATRVVGLIGGMSWKTTALYYEAINKQVAAKLGGIHSANILIRSLDYAKISDFIAMKNYEGMTDLFCKTGKELKSAGAQALVLCANVAHKSAGDLERQSGLPVLHIADFTAREIVKQSYKRVGLLATRAVMEDDFYKGRLKGRFGLDVVVPDHEFRVQADRLIFDELSKDKVDPEVVSIIHSAYQQLVREKDVECMILGCTEFRLVFTPENITVPTFETTALHAKGVADWLLDEKA